MVVYRRTVNLKREKGKLVVPCKNVILTFFTLMVVTECVYQFFTIFSYLAGKPPQIFPSFILLIANCVFAA